jgi:hypothetical protein
MRVQVYGDYSYATARVDDLCHRLARSRGLPTSSTPLPIQSGLDELTRAATERNQQLQRVQLVGDPATVAAAQEWNLRTWRMEKFAHGELNDPDLWHEATRTADEAQSNFYTVARSDLGITSNRAASAVRR